MTAGHHTASKAQVRAAVLAARRSMSPAERASADTALTRTLLDLPELRSARCVAAYHSFGTEPPTSAVLAALRSRGVRVLLPVVRPDRDLDWAIYDVSSTRPQRRDRLWTPPGPREGVDAVAAADVVVVPALAVGRDGVRLGRGGGSYDRALARVPGATPVVALLYAGELRADVPSEPHDRPVTLVVEPDAVHRVGADRAEDTPA